MAQVAQLTGLTQLSLRGCAGLTGAPGAGFECLRALGALRSLNLSQCDALQARPPARGLHRLARPERAGSYESLRGGDARGRGLHGRTL
jgi:hypothetical protein